METNAEAALNRTMQRVSDNDMCMTRFLMQFCLKAACLKNSSSLGKQKKQRNYSAPK
jgi:hypothetical protein